VTDNGLLIVIIIALAILAVFVFMTARRGSGNHDKRGDLEKLQSSGHYWGVKIRPGQCNAIRPFAGRQFSFEEAPGLPMRGCTAKRCSCSYVGVTEHRREERRIQMDRRSIARMDDEHADRRSLRGRRGNKARVDPAD
jgi:hypothetical protein